MDLFQSHNNEVDKTLNFHGHFYSHSLPDLGFVRETGGKVPCKGQQMYFWMPPAATYDRQLWGGSAPSIWVGGA